jgi:hypothetical protein
MTGDRDTLTQRITSDVDALVDPSTHVQPYTIQVGKELQTRSHRIQFPSLLDQMRDQSTDGMSPAVDDDGGSFDTFGSKPPVNLQAIDRLRAIHAGVRSWRGKTKLDRLEAELRHLVGDCSRLDVDELELLARDAGRWVTWARIVTGWTTPPFRPRASCPACEQRDSLHVHLVEVNALCTHCGSTWDRDTIGLLAAHITGQDHFGGVTPAAPQLEHVG